MGSNYFKPTTYQGVENRNPDVEARGTRNSNNTTSSIEESATNGKVVDLNLPIRGMTRAQQKTRPYDRAAKRKIAAVRRLVIPISPLRKANSAITLRAVITALIIPSTQLVDKTSGTRPNRMPHHSQLRSIGLTGTRQ